MDPNTDSCIQRSPHFVIPTSIIIVILVKVLIHGGYLNMSESLYTRVIIWVNTILITICYETGVTIF